MILYRDEKGEQNVSNIILISVRSRETNFEKIGFSSFTFEFREFKLFKPVGTKNHVIASFFRLEKYTDIYIHLLNTSQSGAFQ